MTTVQCQDGSVLDVRPVPVLGRDGVPYEVSLLLLRDGEPFGEVGERCGYFLATTAARLRAARAAGRPFPVSSLEAGVRAHAEDRGVDADESWRDVLPYLPRDRDLFSFHARDPDDLASVGELRARLVESREWSQDAWALASSAVLEAWGSDGVGVRAHLSSEELLTFLQDLVQEFATVGAAYEADDDASGLRRPVG
jgi:hypothetical protein